MLFNKAVLAVVGGSLLVCGMASASTLSLYDTNSTVVGFLPVKQNISETSYPVYASFTIGSEGYDLLSISALLTPIAPSASYSATISSGSIGNVVDTLNSVSGASVVYGTPSFFTDNISLALTPNTTYWIGISASVNTGFWAYTDDANLTVTTDAYGTTLNPGALDSAGNSSVFTPVFSVQAVPEPGTLALAGLGALSLMALRRKKA
jgi:hypothetical protein